MIMSAHAQQQQQGARNLPPSHSWVDTHRPPTSSQILLPLHSSSSTSGISSEASASCSTNSSSHSSGKPAAERKAQQQPDIYEEFDLEDEREGGNPEIEEEQEVDIAKEEELKHAPWFQSGIPR